MNPGDGDYANKPLASAACRDGAGIGHGQGVKQAVCQSWLAGQNGWCAPMQG